MRKWTGKSETDCYTNEQAIANMNDLVVEVKKSNQFFSPKTYLDNDNIMNSEFKR